VNFYAIYARSATNCYPGLRGFPGENGFEDIVIADIDRFVVFVQVDGIHGTSFSEYTPGEGFFQGKIRAGPRAGAFAVTKFNHEQDSGKNHESRRASTRNHTNGHEIEFNHEGDEGAQRRHETTLYSFLLRLGGFLSSFLFMGQV
jgi:hypothetical protein